ncbi:MAG: 50S ribosomal protein L22 [Candidatus Levybacteria bacterium]|nr:50S ribosomal protein L22 [Candidatus Levybacteria bacterium]
MTFVAFDIGSITNGVSMEYIAIAKNIKISPRKVRLVVDSVKKQNLNKALSILSLMPKRAAQPVKKAIDSAIANAVNNFKVNREALSLRDIIVGEGARLKRYHFAARGRVRPYKRRTSHIRVILTDNKLKTENLKLKTEGKTENVQKGIVRKELTR